MSLPKARTQKEYQEFVKEQLTVREIKIPFLSQDVFVKLFYLDLSPVSRIKSATPTEELLQDLLKICFAPF